MDVAGEEEEQRVVVVVVVVVGLGEVRLESPAVAVWGFNGFCRVLPASELR